MSNLARPAIASKGGSVSLQSKPNCGATGVLKDTSVAPRVAPLVNRFRGNVREDLLAVFLSDVWASLVGHLAAPVRVSEAKLSRNVTFMRAIRFSISKTSGMVTVTQLEEKSGKVLFARHDKATVINLPARLDGFWLDAFLVPWGTRMAECLIDHSASGSGISWYAAVKRELLRSVGRGTHWYRLRCALRDALQLDPQVILWCRKGRPSYRDYVTQVQYNQVLADRVTYQRIHDDNRDLVWLYNFLRAENLQPKGDQPVAGMKDRLLGEGGIGEAGWRLIANGKEQDFRHIIDFVDEHGGISGRAYYLPKWLRLLTKLRSGRAVPGPLLGLFTHDIYDAETGDRVRFRNNVLQTGTMRAILNEGERRLANGSHRKFIEEDVVEVVTWLEHEQPVLDKNQLKQGWKYLASRTAAWKVEAEACDTLKELTWESLLPETQIGQWRIVPLTDAWQLRQEALRQRHCADQHISECLSGTYRHFSVRTNQGKSVATIGIERKGMNWMVFGFREFANRPVRETLLGLDAEVLRRYADLWRLSAESGAAPALVDGARLASTAIYPHLVVRIYSAVYQREPIEVRYGSPAVNISRRGTYVQHPEPFATVGELSEGCRTLLLEGVLEAVKRLRFRMCVVWGPTSCSYVEVGDSVDHSSEPPSCGIALPSPIKFDQGVKRSKL